MFKMARPLAALMAPIALIAALFALAAPARAQTPIIVPANAGWQHGETGLILRARIAGLTRGEIKDSSAAELDIMAQYASADGRTSVTVYIFRPALDSVPVWFDRSETQILVRDTYGKAAPLADPLAFAPPRATTTSALRRTYVPSKGPYKSTGLVMMPLGKWLVAVRVSSVSIEPAQLDATMSAIVAGIGWPQAVAESPAAVPVAACAQPLAYAKRAKMRAPSMQDAIVGGAAVSLTAEGEGNAAPILCRDLPPTSDYGVYRDPAATNSYLLAVGDAGIIISIAPDMFAEGKSGFRMIAGFLDHHAIYSVFDKFPHPDDVMKTVRSVNPAASVSLDGKTVEINVSALK